MILRVVHFLSLLFVALTLGPSLAHLLEMPNKIGLSPEEYLTVQKIYHGWALLGFIVFGALFWTLLLTVAVWNRARSFRFALVALLNIVAAQAVFWLFTYPANVSTVNWTILPENWLELRRQWEYSHATGAALNLIAFIALTLSVLDTTHSSRKGVEQ